MIYRCIPDDLTNVKRGGRTSDKFLAVPVLRKNNDLLGVMRVPKIAKDSDFTELDVNMLQSLAYHVAIAIENIENFEREITNQNKMTQIYNSLMQEDRDEGKLIHIILTCLTHGDGIGFNRATIFEFETVPELLRGRMSLGPLNSEDGKKMREELEQSKEFMTFQKCIEEYDRRNGPVKNTLFQEIAGKTIQLGDNCRLLSEIRKEEEAIHEIEKEDFERMLGINLRDLLISMDTSKIWLIILPVIKQKTFIIICDNVYTQSDLDLITMHLIGNFLNLSVKALRSLYHKEALRIARESAWQDIAANASHRLGQFLPIIENRLWEEKETSRFEKKKFWEETLNLINSAMDVVRDLRLLSAVIRLDSIKDFTIEEFLSGVANFLEGAFKDVSFEEDYQLPRDNMVITVDMNRITEAVAALVKNSKEAKSENLAIRLSTAELKDSETHKYNLSPNQRYIIFSISDNGPGIRPELKEKIFIPFFTTKLSGTGLGLANTQRIIEAHKGKIMEEGSFGSGAFFKIILPVKEGN